MQEVNRKIAWRISLILLFLVIFGFLAGVYTEPEINSNSINNESCECDGCKTFFNKDSEIISLHCCMEAYYNKTETGDFACYKDYLITDFNASKKTLGVGDFARKVFVYELIR